MGTGETAQILIEGHLPGQKLLGPIRPGPIERFRDRGAGGFKITKSKFCFRL